MNASADYTETATGRSSPLVRGVVGGALAITAALLAYFLLWSGNGHRYELMFESGGQLVTGNLVMIGGHPVGSIEEIDIAEDNQARITISIDQPLHEGTNAVIRTTSLTGVANRYISVSPGPNSEAEIPEGGTVESVATTSPVDLDQLFNTFTPEMRESFSDFIKGNAAIWEGRGSEARESLKYFAPALNQTTLWLRELNADQRMLTRFVTDTAQLSSTVASRDEDLTSGISNANSAFGAIAEENRSLSRALSSLPSTMRQANTTFVNLRAALDDLDPLVEASLPATEDLAPFLRELQPVLARSEPVFRDVGVAMERPGSANDLGELTESLPRVQQRASRAFASSRRAIDDFQPTLNFMRPYWGEMITGFSNLGKVAGFYSGNGHFVRIQPSGMNLFEYDAGSEQLEPISPSEQFEPFPSPEPAQRCPGGGTQPAEDGSSPFYNPPWPQSGLSGDDCDPGQVPPGS